MSELVKKIQRYASLCTDVELAHERDQKANARRIGPQADALLKEIKNEVEDLEKLRDLQA